MPTLADRLTTIATAGALDVTVEPISSRAAVVSGPDADTVARLAACAGWQRETDTEDPGAWLVGV